MPTPPSNTGPLSDIKVLDLSRILAGPLMSQILGDMGADIIKIEHPCGGDDTRKWGPPYIESPDELDEGWSSYYLCANRNKRSVAIDISKPEGQRLVERLITQTDILIENFKVDGLKKYGLDYKSLAKDNPSLIYCSITGFGQSGPLAHRPGYDAMIQAMGGIMSITGAPNGPPMKIGVGMADVMCGMYAGQAVLAALHHRNRTNEGQHIDMSLFDSQLAWLINEGMNCLVSGDIPERRGTAHPNIVPYQVFPTRDGHFMLAVGNDNQFAAFCKVANADHLATDEKYATNPARILNREQLVEIINNLTRRHTSGYWLEKLEHAGVPCGPLNTIKQSLNHEQAIARNMVHDMTHEVTGIKTELIANPIKFEKTPVNYRHFPPRLGEHTFEVLSSTLGLDPDALQQLVDRGTIADQKIKTPDKETS